MAIFDRAIVDRVVRLVDLARLADRQDERVAGEVRERTAPGTEQDGERQDEQGSLRGPQHGIADRRAEQREQHDDERRHEERIPPIGGDLVVERCAGHDPSRADGQPGSSLDSDQLRLRSTLGTLAAS